MEEQVSIIDEASETESSRQISDDTLASLSLKTENNLNDFTVIFVDAQLETSSDSQRLLTDLEKIVARRVLAFNDFESSYTLIQENELDKVFLIMSGTLGENYCYLFAEISQIECIYIFCRHRDKHIQWSRNIEKTHNIDIVAKFYPYIGDLYEQLQRCYQSYCLDFRRKESVLPIRGVYRDQYNSKIELERLKDHCRARNSHVLLNMFGSASRNPKVAVQFIQGIRSGYIPCLYEIIIPDCYHTSDGGPKIYSCQPFADISAFASIPDEQEVLFSVASRFCVRYVGNSTARRPWVPITLELFVDDWGFDRYWHLIGDMVRHESDEMKKELFKLIHIYAKKIEEINWQVWWQKLEKQCGARRRDNEPLVVTMYECFGDSESLVKAIELRKKDIIRDSRFTGLSMHECFSLAMDEMKFGKPTRIIALYEQFVQTLYPSIDPLNDDTNKIIQTLHCVGDAYASLYVYKENALKCYAEALRLTENTAVHCLQNKIEQLRSHILHDKSDHGTEQKKKHKQKKKDYYSSNEELSLVQVSDYETEHMQWSILWKFHKIVRAFDFEKRAKGRLRYLQSFLNEKEKWIDSNDLRIFLNIPLQNQNTMMLPSDMHKFFFLSIWSYLYESSMHFDEHSLNLWRYEKFMTEWLTLNDVKRMIKHYTDPIITLILSILDRIIKKLELILIICLMLICMSSRPVENGLYINVNRMNFLIDEYINTPKLIFFDDRDEITGDTVRAELELLGNKKKS